MKRKNLIFFMTDQQRADTLGTVVNGQEITPNWNALYADSVSFSKAYDSCPLCVPARTSLATGMNPLHTGMLLNDLPGKYAKDNIPLHEYLYRNGYEVAHVGVNHISLNPKLKDRIVFSRWVDDESYREYAEGKGFDISRQPLQCDYVQENCEGEYKKRPYSNTKVMEWGYSLEDFKDIWFTDKAVEYMTWYMSLDEHRFLISAREFEYHWALLNEVVKKMEQYKSTLAPTYRDKLETLYDLYVKRMNG